MKVQRLDSPSAIEIEEIVGVGERAFANDLLHRCMTGDDREKLRAYFRAAARATALEGEIYVGRLDNFTTIRAFSFVFGPNKGLFMTEEQRALGYSEYYDGLSDQTKEWLGMLQERVEKFVHGAAPNIFVESWWVSEIATDPPFQCRGLGTALVNKMRARAFDAGKRYAFCTQTEKNRDWYIGLKLKQLAETYDTFPAKPYGDFVPCFLLEALAQG